MLPGTVFEKQRSLIPSPFHVSDQLPGFFFFPFVFISKCVLFSNHNLTLSQLSSILTYIIHLERLYERGSSIFSKNKNIFK